MPKSALQPPKSEPALIGGSPLPAVILAALLGTIAIGRSGSARPTRAAALLRR